MHLHSSFIYIPVRIEVAMEVPARKPAILYFHTTNFNDTVPLCRIEASRFGIQYDLSHKFPIHPENRYSISRVCKRLNSKIGQLICNFIFAVATVPFYPFPLHLVSGSQVIQLHPQIGV